MAELKFNVAGLFISNGKGIHVTRTINTSELIFVKSGTLHIRVGNSHYAVHAGQWLIMPAGVEHGGTQDYEKNLSFFWGHFYDGKEEISKSELYGNARRQDFFTGYFSMLIKEQEFPDNSEVCTLLMKILLKETRRHMENKTEASNASSLAQSAKRIIDLKFDSPLSSSAVAEELNCNADHLGKVFRKAYNCTMLEYLNDKRCCEAEYLLRNGTSSVKEIAFFCGFNDLPYFRRQFFKRYSVTPTQYRQLNQTKDVNTMNVGIPEREVK